MSSIYGVVCQIRFYLAGADFADTWIKMPEVKRLTKQANDLPCPQRSGLWEKLPYYYVLVLFPTSSLLLLPTTREIQI